MAEISDIMIEKFAKAVLRAANTQQTKKPKACTAEAEVLRVENGMAYVHIPGGAPETPARETIACKAGDIVQVRLENGKASLTGNRTAPPTDDTKAEEAAQLAEAAGEAADEAQETADNIKQYFWFKNGKGSEAGAHVTEVSRETFEKDPQGGNILIRSNSLRLRMALITLAELVNTGLKVYEPGDDTNPVAQFLNTGVVLGKQIYSWLKLDTTFGMRFYWGNIVRATINGNGIIYEDGAGHDIVIGAGQLDCHGRDVEAPDISIKWGSGDGKIAHYKPVMQIPVEQSSITLSDSDVNVQADDGLKINGSRLIKIETYTSSSVSISSGTSQSISKTFTMPSPYRQVIGVRRVETNNNSNCTISSFDVSGDGAVGNTVTLYATVFNKSASDRSTTVTWEIALSV